MWFVFTPHRYWNGHLELCVLKILRWNLFLLINRDLYFWLLGRQTCCVDYTVRYGSHNIHREVCITRRGARLHLHVGLVYIWDWALVITVVLAASITMTSLQWCWHYGYVIMDAIASQITSLTIVYSTVYSDADDRKHQNPASLAFVRGIYRGAVNSPQKMASNAENVSIWWRHHEDIGTHGTYNKVVTLLLQIHSCLLMR